MATLAELIENVVSIKKHIDVYAALPRLNPKQTAALRTNLGQLGKNLAALAAYQPPIEATRAAQDAAPFDAPPVDPAYFVSAADAGDDVYIAGLEGGLSGEGVDWTLNRAIGWFKYVWTNGIAYHAVAPGLLPGSHCLSAEGYKFAVDFQRRDDLTVAPHDFNPLNLQVKA